MADKEELVLVTGGSGFIAIYCIIKCLSENYRVRTTVRSLKRQDDVLEMLRAANINPSDNLSFVEADLTKDDGWADAVKDCTYILHVASPLPATLPKHEDELIIPARDGTLRVLKAARDAGVKRVVVTSSFGAMCYGHHGRDQSIPFTEKDWTNIEGDQVPVYIKSKTIAERAAWDFMKQEGSSLELAVVNPSVVAGPVLGHNYSPTVEIFVRLMDGSMLGSPRICYNIVDVRDVADIHFLAMIKPEAKGERFICAAPPEMTIREMALALREKLGYLARRAPTGILPDFVIRLTALFMPDLRMITPELGITRRASIDKAKGVFGWEPRSTLDTIAATGESLLKHGVVKPPR